MKTRRKYKVYQEGGATQDNTGADVFNNYVDQLLASASEQSDYTEPTYSSQEDEGDYISNLREYDDQQKPSQEDYFNTKFNQLTSLLDQKLAAIQQQQQEFDWFATDEGNEYLANQYDTQASSTQAAANYGDNTPVAKPGLNNYGNIRDDSGQFKSFATPDQGKSALLHQLELYKTGKTKNNVSPTSTLYQAMAVYAPSSDKNDPKHYAEFIANKLGITPTTQIKDIDTEKWANAIAVMEGNKNIR